MLERFEESRGTRSGLATLHDLEAQLRCPRDDLAPVILDAASCDEEGLTSPLELGDRLDGGQPTPVRVPSPDLGERQPSSHELGEPRPGHRGTLLLTEATMTEVKAAPRRSEPRRMRTE